MLPSASAIVEQCPSSLRAKAPRYLSANPTTPVLLPASRVVHPSPLPLNRAPFAPGRFSVIRLKTSRKTARLEWHLVKGCYRPSWLDRPYRACELYPMMPRALP